MAFDRDSFIDIIRLQTPSGLIPSEIPAHYWHFCWVMRRKAMGNKAQAVDWRSAVARSKPIRLPYSGA